MPQPRGKPQPDYVQIKTKDGRATINIWLGKGTVVINGKDPEYGLKMVEKWTQSTSGGQAVTASSSSTASASVSSNHDLSPAEARKAFEGAYGHPF